MKEKSRSIHISLPPIKLYLDDIQSIYEILKNHCNTVTIETDRYELNDVGALKDIKADSLSELTVRGTSPYVSISFEKDGARIYVEDDSIPNRGIVSKIDEALKRCKRSIARVFTGWKFHVVALSTALIAFALIGNLLSGWLAIFLIVCALVLYAGLFTYNIMLDTHKYSTIILTERRYEKSFFTRNKDRILVGIITAVVTALLTFTIIKLTQ